MLCHITILYLIYYSINLTKKNTHITYNNTYCIHVFRNMIQTNIESPVQISLDVKTKYLSDPFLNLLFNVTNNAQNDKIYYFITRF